VRVESVATVAVITPDAEQSRRLYVDVLGLPLSNESGGDYIYTDKVPGAKHFAVWPLSQAATACFGREEWPADVAVPQASFEFEVADAPAVQDAADELAAAGHELLHSAREEPWGQTVARLLSPEGVIVGISHIPSMH
jgi:catechol 2,3-dioxygenase-like lactoylglutathione lyase family enzyme